MRIVRSVRSMQALAKSLKADHRRLCFVPTMGCLHAGHASLMSRARRFAGPDGGVVVSIYVNPAQFGPKEDFTRYPRTWKSDVDLCQKAGVDILFAASDEEMYPQQNRKSFSTYVVEEALSQRMEGASRPTHFRGVTTIVAKLFNIVLPDAAVFGAKDFQQAAIIRRMIADLNFPVRMIVSPTVRERDGLAMSSRNRYLNAGERAQAAVLWKALQHARQMVARARGPVPFTTINTAMRRVISTQPAARVDYIEVFDPETLEPLRAAARGSHLALAVFIGSTRLIDNAPL